MKSQYRLWRKTIPAALAAALALPLAPAPEAEAAALSFADVSRDASWSLGSVVELTQRGIFSGYPDGTFGPNRAVTRLETLVAAVRQMGLRAEAESAEAKRARLSAADAELIRKQYAWATGYVEMAEDHDLLDDEKAELKPGEPADRLFATKVLVRALGLEKEAEAAMGSDLPFRDKAEVNEAAVGYVAVAVEYGLVAGYDDNTFRPGRRVSRAELATLLDRAGDKLPDPKGEFAQASGTVSGVSGREVTLRQTAGATQTFFVGEAATLVRGGRLATPSDLVPGD
ncbi:MAG TPA: S-layer homology domain-containing protein, partial [Paenibacillus sp.]|nr:S-layer homology domain-containing protein [Paenibacillus sp.]